MGLPPQPHAPAANPRPSCSLVVVADDFGFGLDVSRGIIQAHRQGPVSATGFMTVTGDHARASAQLLADAPALEVGLHLVLTRAGATPALATKSSGLVGRDGAFLPKELLLLRAITGRIDPRAAFDEIAAQAQLFTQLVGRPPVYVDGHHHVHEFPVIRDALRDAVAAGVLPPITRITIEPAPIHQNVSGAYLRRLVLHRLGLWAQRRFAPAAIRANDYWFGELSPADWRSPFPWDRYLKHLPEAGIVEWMVHPGLLDQSLQGRDTYIAQRPRELQALTDPALRHHWASLPLLGKSASHPAASPALGPGRGAGIAGF